MSNLTVLIPVYNTKPEHLRMAVNSILHQDISEKPIVILIDDGSDNAQTISAILNCILIGCIGIRIDHKGTSAALNEGHRHVKTEWVAIMGSDDTCSPNRLRLQMEYLKAHPETDIIGTNLTAFYDGFPGREIFRTHHAEYPVGPKGNVNWLVNHGTVIYRQSAIEKSGWYNESKMRGQDIDLWGRMIAHNFIFRNLTQVLYQWRRYK